MIINDFSAGLNTRLNPFLLPPNAATVFTNVDNSDNTLKPTKTNKVLMFTSPGTDLTTNEPIPLPGPPVISSRSIFG